MRRSTTFQAIDQPNVGANEIAYQARSQLARFIPHHHFKMNGKVDFDLPAKEIFTTHQHQRQISHTDLSMCSYTTSQSISSSSLATNAAKQYSDYQYGEALQNLAESMKRSEQSRRVVAMMKRMMLTTEQQCALFIENAPTSTRLGRATSIMLPTRVK